MRAARLGSRRLVCMLSLFAFAGLAQQDVTQQFIKRHDRNGDARLTKDELPPNLRRAFDRVDSNTDGFISADEDRAFRKKRSEQRMKQQRNRRPPTRPADSADIAYGPHPKQRLDFWRADSAEPAPLVLFIHGGGFRGGDKRAVNPQLLDALLEAGLAVASLNYRLSDVGPFPMQMHDCARALQFIRHHAREYNVAPARIGATGGSAGAGISQWLAFHEDLADPASDDPIARQSTRLCCAAPFAAQTSYDPRFIQELFDTTAVDGALIPFFGMEKAEDINNPVFHPLFEEASPINHLTADDPPIFLYYPQRNQPLPPNSTGGQHIHHPAFGGVLKAKMDELGIECTVRLREEAPGFPVQEIVNFFLKHLGKNAP